MWESEFGGKMGLRFENTLTILTIIGWDDNLTTANGSTWITDWGINNNDRADNLYNNNKYEEASTKYNKIYNKIYYEVYYEV